MKNKKIYILLISAFFIYSNTIYSQFRLVSDNLPVWIANNSTTYTSPITFRNDLTGNSFQLSSVDTTAKVFTSFGQLYDVESINDISQNSCSLTIKDSYNNGTPYGTIMLFDTIYKNRKIPQIPFFFNGATNQLQSAVDAWNARIDTINQQFISRVSLDTTLNYLNPPINNSYVLFWDSVSNNFNWLLIESNNEDTIAFTTDFTGDGVNNAIALSSKNADISDLMAWDGNKFIAIESTNGIYDNSDTLIENTSVFLDDNYFRVPFSTGNDTLLALTNGIKYSYFLNDNDLIKLISNELHSNSSNKYIDGNTYGRLLDNMGINVDTLFLNFDGVFDPNGVYLLEHNTSGRIYPIDILTLYGSSGWLKDSLSAGDVIIDANNNAFELNISNFKMYNFGAPTNVSSDNRIFFIGQNPLHSNTYNAVMFGRSNTARLTYDQGFVTAKFKNIFMNGLENDLLSKNSIDTLYNSVIVGSNSTTSIGNNSLVVSSSASILEGDNVLGIGDIFKTNKNNSFVKGYGNINLGIGNEFNETGFGNNQTIKQTLINTITTSDNEFVNFAQYQFDTIRKTILVSGTLKAVVADSDNNGFKIGESISRDFNALLISTANTLVIGSIDTLTNNNNNTLVVAPDGSAFTNTGFGLSRTGKTLFFNFKPGVDILGNTGGVTFKTFLDLKVTEMRLLDLIQFVPSACTVFATELSIQENSGVLTYNSVCDGTLNLNWTLPDDTSIDAIANTSVTLSDIGTYTISGTCDTCFADDIFIYCDPLTASISFNEALSLLILNTPVVCNDSETTNWTYPDDATSSSKTIPLQGAGTYTVDYNCGGCDTTLTYDYCDNFNVEIVETDGVLSAAQTNCGANVTGLWLTPSGVLNYQFNPTIDLTSAESGLYVLSLICDNCVGQDTFEYLQCQDVFAEIVYDELENTISINDTCANQLTDTLFLPNGTFTTNIDTVIDNPTEGLYYLNYECGECVVKDTLTICPAESTLSLLRNDSCSFDIVINQNINADSILIEITNPTFATNTVKVEYTNPFSYDVDVVNNLAVIDGVWTVDVNILYSTNNITDTCAYSTDTITINDPCDSLDIMLSINQTTETLTSTVNNNAGDTIKYQWYRSGTFGIIDNDSTVNLVTEGYGVFTSVIYDIYACQDGIVETTDDIQCFFTKDTLYCPEENDLSFSTILNGDILENSYQTVDGRPLNQERSIHDVSIYNIGNPSITYDYSSTPIGINEFNIDLTTPNNVPQGELIVRNDVSLIYDVPLMTTQTDTCGVYTSTDNVCYFDYANWNVFFQFNGVENLWRFNLPYYITTFSYVIEYDLIDGSGIVTQDGNQDDFTVIFETLTGDRRTHEGPVAQYNAIEADITVTINWTTGTGNCSGTFVDGLGGG